MSPEDRELLQVLRRQQLDLQRSLARIDVQLNDLEGRLTAEEQAPPVFSPLHTEHAEPPPLPEHLLHPAPHPPFPPLPPNAESLAHELPPVPPHHVPTAGPSFEFQFGRWLIGLAAIFGVITLALIFSWAHHGIYQLLGPGGVLGLSALAGIGVVIAGQRLARRGESREFVGNSLSAMALAWLYLTAYAACYCEPLQIIHSPVIAGLLLLSWSVYVFLLAERRHSQLLSLFAITLAYLSTSINPVGRFTMTADLLLAGTAVLFMVRNGWATLTFVSLLATYGSLLRRLVLDENGELVLDTSRTLHFWPYAMYLIGAWFIFTAAVIFTSSPAFRGGKRLAFLSLNNGALAGLLLLTTYISGYGHGPMGWVLLATGFALLIASRLVGWAQIEPEKVMAAYAAQGLALFTTGIIVLFTGVTRGLLLMLETLFLGAAAVFSGDRVLTVTTYAAGFFATLFLIWEIAANAHYPWLLGTGGAFVLLLNAWWARNEVMNGPRSRTTIVLASSYFCVLALGLIFTTLNTDLSDNALPPGLAIAALVLTFSIYFVRIYELPPLAQTLLVIAQALVLFPAETGEEVPWWTTAWVAAITLLMLTWWSRQRVTRSGSWVAMLNLVYALALACLAYQAIRPHVDAQNWLVCSALLSVAFLVWGAFTRVWPIAAVGQVFLAIAVYHFFIPPGVNGITDEIRISDSVLYITSANLPWYFNSLGFNPNFPWTWWAAAMPLLVVVSTARATHSWLRLSPEIPGEWSTTLRALAYGYQVLATIMLIRLIHAVVYPPDQVAILLCLGSLILSWNARHPSAFGIRCSYLLSLAGLALYIHRIPDDTLVQATFLNALAFLSFLAQPALVRPAKKIVSYREVWALILVAAFAGWLFTSDWVLTRSSSGYLTMGWGLYALFLVLFGQFTSERRLTWCGYGILIATIIRVGLVDFWGFSNGYKIVTFLVLTIIVFGIGYLNLRSHDQTKPTAPPPNP